MYTSFITFILWLNLHLIPSTPLKSQKFFEDMIHNQQWYTVFDSTPTTFAAQWHRQPMIYRNIHKQPANFFGLKDLDPLLYSSTSIAKDGKWNNGKLPSSPEDFSLVKLIKGKDKEWWAGTLPMKVLDVKKASKATNHGFSLIFNKVDERWRSIYTASKQLESIVGQRVGTNLYLTPPVSQGFESHFDYMDVFVVQMHGSKHWRIYNNPFIISPRQDQKFKPNLSQLKSVPHEDFLLHHGDVLYIPSGYVHDARVKGLSNPSLHLSFGIEVDVAFRWEGMLHQGIKLKFQNIEKNVEMHSNDDNNVNNKCLRMLCHTAISLLSTVSTDGLFGMALPSLKRGTLSLNVSSFSKAWFKHLYGIESYIQNTIITDATATTSNQTGDNITMKEILLHWKYRQDLVHACWRGGRFASKEVDSIENGGPPPNFIDSSLTNSTLLNITNLKNILLSIIKDQTLIKDATNNVEIEFNRRLSYTNKAREFILKKHEQKFKMLFSDKIEL
jgi:hypothetical protein